MVPLILSHPHLVHERIGAVSGPRKGCKFRDEMAKASATTTRRGLNKHQERFQISWAIDFGIGVPRIDLNA